MWSRTLGAGVFHVSGKTHAQGAGRAVDHTGVDESRGFWSEVAHLLWQQLRDSGLLPSIAVATLTGLALLNGGAAPMIVISAVTGGIAAGRAVITVMEPVRTSMRTAMDDYLAGRSDEDVVGAGYWVARVAVVILPPLGALWLTSQLAAMLPYLPSGYGNVLLAMAVLGLCTSWTRTVIRRLRRQLASGAAAQRAADIDVKEV